MHSHIFSSLQCPMTIPRTTVYFAVITAYSEGWKIVSWRKEREWLKSQRQGEASLGLEGTMTERRQDDKRRQSVTRTNPMTGRVPLEKSSTWTMIMFCFRLQVVVRSGIVRNRDPGRNPVPSHLCSWSPTCSEEWLPHGASWQLFLRDVSCVETDNYLLPCIFKSKSILWYTCDSLGLSAPFWRVWV